jgi:GT2 family glycosyltransferase
MSSKVYIIVLNWNGWQDTIECLESIFRSDYPSYTVVLCDNGSQDGSLAKLKLWAEGKLNVALPPFHALRPLSHPPVCKPIRYCAYDRETAEAGGSPEAQGVSLIFISIGQNLGFSGGNNVGLRYALSKQDADYIWLLNNDTVILADALAQNVDRAKRDPQIGALGSQVLYYHNPETINAVGGGRIWKYLASSRHPLIRRPATEISAASIKLDYIYGASCFLPSKIIKEIGLLDEAFAPAYWEDGDWGMRITRAGYKNLYHGESVVYHKKGGSGVTRDPRNDYLDMRNAVIFSRKYFGSSGIFFGLIKMMLMSSIQIYRKQIHRIPMLLRAFYDGLVAPINKYH